MRHEVLNWKDLFGTVRFLQFYNNLISQFDLDKVGKSGVKFDQKKLEYFNSMHIRNKYEYFDELEAKKCVNSWRKMLLDTLPKEYHSAIKKINEPKMKKIMDLMKVRIHFFHDMNNHTYFFEDPTYED